MNTPDSVALASTSASGLRIVGLGASAGGLEPLQQFMSGVPAGSSLAYIVVQHMDPTHKAQLVELLQRATAMPVREAVDLERIEPDTVYVIPPNAELSVLGGLLRLTVPSKPRGQRLPIDVLFSSLARALGERAVGVVLSGMGSDGTLGLQAIKSQGGLTVVQQPDSAQFDSMPQSAISTGCADLIALPGDMPGRILKVARVQLPAMLPAPAGPQPAALALILDQLRRQTRHDLSQYKPSTLMRRIARRMAVHDQGTIEAYAEFLRQNAQERELLFKELLIGVTSFFRDAAVWQEVKDAVLPALVARHHADATRMRAWVVGCSTGEEAFTLAMVFTEVCEAAPEGAACAVQIFATDLSADAIAMARRGHYPASIARDLTPERLARFFTAQAGGFQIDKRLREMVLFAQHDAILDPPFTRLDFLSCRNLMIYFDANLQRRLVPLFHYSLRTGGALLLGSSETAGRTQSLFTPLHGKSRLYWRLDNDNVGSSAFFPTPRRPSSLKAVQENFLAHPLTPPDNLQALADHLLLQAFSPPAVLVNEAGDIVYISGRTGAFLEPAAGKANWNIHVMARPGIRAQLGLALRTALQEKSSIELRGLCVTDGAAATVDITVRAVVQPKAIEGMAMVVFREVPGTVKPRRRRGVAEGAAGAAEVAVSEEMLSSLEEIRALRQEMEASKEELQAANEELQSTNEELQSANEELTTSKEEAQSMNEELQTINVELQSKLDDLALAQSDMQNLLNSTDIATLFLDNQLNVRRFTDQIARVVHLREGDIGRPLSELASTLIYPALHTDVKETLRTLVFSQKEIATTDGLWFSVRIMPYRTLANVIRGAVITFVDITAAKHLESKLRLA